MCGVRYLYMATWSMLVLLATRGEKTIVGLLTLGAHFVQAPIIGMVGGVRTEVCPFSLARRPSPRWSYWKHFCFQATLQAAKNTDLSLLRRLFFFGKMMLSE